MSTTNTQAAFTFVTVAFANLALYEKNPRKDLGDVKALAATILGAGRVIKPLTGFLRDGVYNIVDGQRRFAALTLINEAGGNEEILNNIPFQVINGSTAEVDLAFLQLLSNEGEPLKPLELAEQILELRNVWDMKTAEIAERLGRSKVYVNQLTKVAELPENVKKLMTNGTLSATLVREQIKAGTIDELIAKVSDGGTTEPGEIIPSTIVKKEKVTQKDLEQVNSIKEFKRFGKAFSEIFPDKTVSLEEVYNFVTQIVHNEVDYNAFLLFFTDEKTVKTAIKAEEPKVIKQDEQKEETKKAAAKKVTPVSTKDAAKKNVPAELAGIADAAKKGEEKAKKVAPKKDAITGVADPVVSKAGAKAGKGKDEAKTTVKTTSRKIGYDKKAGKATEAVKA